MNIRNATNKQVSFLVSLLVVLLNGLFLIGLNHFIEFSFVGPRDYLILFFSLIASLGITYLCIQSFYEKYIFRKIKLIYKIITAQKIELEDKQKLGNQAYNLESVGLEVQKWATNTRKELEGLKSLETYRRQYVGDISHELKTPIFTVQGYIHTLIEGGLYDDKINMDYLKRAAKNIERLQTIVEDLELINKLEEGKSLMSTSKFDITGLVKEVFEDMESACLEKNIELELKQNSEQIFLVLADMESIRQVLNNLITNSIKYGKQNGKTRVGLYRLDAKLLIEISDDGIGIDEDHLKHVFDRFYRIDASRSRMIGGSGLGLSIVKHIIEAHHESINVRSTPGIGSTFGFTLPLSN